MKTLATELYEVQEWLGEGTLNLFGVPFAGKDSQSDRLGRFLGVEPLGGGEILRNSDIPAETRASMDSGELIPSDDYRQLVMPYLSQTAFAGRPLILSSVGRVKGEEAGVLAATEAAGHPTLAVPYLDVTEDEAFRRFQITPDRGRADDSPESLRTRFEEFAVKTQPVLDTYESMGLLVPVDAMDEEELVFAAMIHALHDYAQAS